jgi:hypothetical protein
MPARVTHPAVRNDPPVADDWGMVVRPILGGIPIIVVSQAQPSIATHSVVAASVVTVTALVANAARLGAAFHNNSAARVIYLRLGAGAALGAYTVRLGPRAFYEIPWPTYTGIVTVIWGPGAGGDLQVTELT